MINEHNPIAQLVTKIQQKWMEEVSPHPCIKLVRWLIKPSQAELYAGFLKLESSPHGKIPEVPVVLLSHFKHSSVYSKTLIKDWLDAFEKDEAFKEALEKNNLNFDWDYEKYKAKLDERKTNFDLLLMEMLTAFQKALPDPKLPLVLTLYPYSIQDTIDYQVWIETMMRLQFPDNVRLMIFDFVEDRQFDDLMEYDPKISKSLSVPLDLEGAVAKIAESGNPSDPVVQFQKYMARMSTCTAQKDLKGLQKWGERGLQIMRKTGIKSNYATAHIIYASMLLNFKKHDQIDTLTKKALKIAKNGHTLGDNICKSLIVQSYGLLASNKQMQKQLKDAAQLFDIQAQKSIEFGLTAQALTAWWLSYTAIRKKDRATCEVTIQKAYEHGVTLDEDTLKASPMRYIAADYYKIIEQNKDEKLCKSIDEFMTELHDENWRTEVEASQKEMNKRKLTSLKLF